MRRILTATLTLLLGGCIPATYRVTPVPLHLAAGMGPADTVVKAPIRVHHRDGRIVMFHSGARFSGSALVGRAEVFTPALDSVTFADSVAYGDVLSATLFRQSVNRTQTSIDAALAVSWFMGAFLLLSIVGDPPVVP